MKRLSAQLVTGLARTAPCDGDDGVFDPLCRVLGGLRGRPVVLKWTRFPPETASGMWVELPELDVLAIRDDTADVEHALVIWGHEVWHMMEGHRAAHTPEEPAATRSRAVPGAVVEQVVSALLAVPDARLGGVDGDLKYAARTDFHAVQETEAERFGLEFTTEMRGYLRRPDLLEVAGRIEKSLGQGPWA